MKAYRLNENRFLLVSHPHYPTRFSYCNRLYALICFHIGTINLAFRRVRVCVRLYGFASMQNSGHTRLRHPCLACSSRCTEPLNPHNLLKSTSTASHHVLASPRKRGGGTAVEVFRLAVQYSNSPAFTILKLFRAVTVGIAPYPHQPSQNRTVPRKPPTPSPP